MLKIEKLDVLNIKASRLCLAFGECIALCAPSGAGKSVFLKGLADLLENEGILSLKDQDRDVIAAPTWRQQVTYVGPKATWWDDEVKAHFQDLDWLGDMMERVDLSSETMNWPVSRLSSGEAQRLCLLRALEVHKRNEAGILLLDEPTSALDDKRARQVEALLQNYLTAKRIGLLFVSHDERQVDRFAQKIWRIEDGFVVEEAKP
ncbi:ATP-binding protein [Terasakiella brassicae]|uniref:ATP-binding protein n=1 Tax=Terasakiella brassicae TaxID=1634917 RepID=A0A917BUF4_9PROT|nr:ATP-binding cassette domain-containing protein [Terasakiella brassicae]GGF57818.1 ATP-binding protein [Terasakiella brassicae]